MGDFQSFRERLLTRLPENVTDNIFRMTSDNLDVILKEAKTYFQIPIERLKFELLDIVDGSVFKNTEYTVQVYPLQEYHRKEAGIEIIQTVDGEFFLRRSKGKVFLMVTEAMPNGKAVGMDEVMEAVKHHPNINSADKSKIQKIVQEASGEWGEISKFDYIEGADAELFVRIEKENMVASVKITEPGVGGADPSEADILHILHDEGIRYGIKMDIVSHLERKPVYNQWIEVARGLETVKGDDAKIELVLSNKKNIVSRKGTASEIKTVTKDSVIARKILETEGVDGRNIFNEILFADAGEPITMTGNVNVRISEDNMEAIALLDGSVYIKDNCVYVDELWIIDGDLTMEIGDIDFPGSIIIEGDIPDDYNIKVNGSLTVLGGIGNSNITVGKNLYIENGINGRGQASIDVGGSCVSKFIESVTLKVGDICLVEDSIINANILSLNKIITAEGRGRISSSVIVAEKEIIAKTIGSELGNPSDIKVVSFAEDREKLTNLQFKLQKIRSDITAEKGFLGDNVSPETFATLPKSQQNHIKEKLLNIKKLQRQQKQIQKIVDAIRKKIVNSSASVQISVIGEIKSGTEITLNEKRTVMKTDLSHLTFKLFDNNITHTSLSSHIKGINPRFFKETKQLVKL